MINYNIDTTENGYHTLTGTVKSLADLKTILIKNDAIPDLLGSLSVEDITGVSIFICAEKGLGLHVGITDAEGMHLSLGNKDTLDETVDVWGDGLYISKGLFVSPRLAWKALEEYITSQKLCNEVEWITPEDIPEEGNFIEL